MKQGWVTWINNTRLHFVNDKLHCDDGPASISESVSSWYKHGELHREDGPAVVWVDNTKFYWYKDKHVSVYSDEEFLAWVKFKAFI